MKSIIVIEYCLLVKRRHVGMADDADSKSVAGNRVRVQVPPPALKYFQEPLRNITHGNFMGDVLFHRILT